MSQHNFLGTQSDATVTNSPDQLQKKPTLYSNFQKYEMLTVGIKDIKIKKRDLQQDKASCNRKPGLALKTMEVSNEKD